MTAGEAGTAAGPPEGAPSGGGPRPAGARGTSPDRPQAAPGAAPHGARAAAPSRAPGTVPDGAREPRPTRVVVVPDGPLLIEGPVEVELDDGRIVRSDRWQVAVCVCRRSGTFPWCDTSHRRRSPGRRSTPAD